jgi:hypothetical protein
LRIGPSGTVIRSANASGAAAPGATGAAGAVAGDAAPTVTTGAKP